MLLRSRCALSTRRCPAAANARLRVAKLGFAPLLSSRAIADCVVPMRRASSAWVMPARSRARRTRVEGVWSVIADTQYSVSALLLRIGAARTIPIVPRIPRIGTRVPWLALLDAGHVAREHWQKLTATERSKLGRLLRKSKGRLSN